MKSEAEMTQLMSVDEIKQSLIERKIHAATVPDLLFFLHRRGLITKESEPDLDRILTRCQRPQNVVFPHRLLEIGDA